MATKDKRVDAYIAKAAPFAQPILKHLRAVVHEGCPDVEETIKWGFPHFMHNGIICSMAAFKQHCALHFWKGSQVVGENNVSDDAMGQFGRVTCIDDLPSKKVLLGYVAKASELRDSPAKKTATPRNKLVKELTVPQYFVTALKTNRKAAATFDAFPYSKRKDYVEWVTDAKTEETRSKRLQTSIEWLAQGKSRNWKYETK